MILHKQIHLYSSEVTVLCTGQEKHYKCAVAGHDIKSEQILKADFKLAQYQRLNFSQLWQVTGQR